MEENIKSIIKWLGSKNRLLPVLEQNIPQKFNRYYEPFFGSGTLFFYLQPSNAVINDINEDIYNLYKIILDKNKQKLFMSRIRTLDNKYYILPFNKRKEFFFNVRDKFNKLKNNKENIKRSIYFVFLTNRCFNSIFKTNKYGNCIVGFGELEGSKRKDTINKNNLINVIDYLSNNKIKIYNKDFEELLRIHEKPKKGDFVYLDPPYFKDDKNSFTMYDKNDFGIEENIRLLELFKWLDKRGVYVMMSNHNVPQIKKMYKDYNIIPIKVDRFVSGRKNNHKMEKYNEVLIKNY